MTRPANKNYGLYHCHSASHRAVMGLIAAAVGEYPLPSLIEDLKQSDPQQLAEIANQNLVHCIIHSAFTLHPELKETVPDDLLIYFQLIYSANAERHQEAKQELITLGKLFHQAAIKAVVLKGGAEILNPYYTDPAHRFISDLDILIPENKVNEAAELLYQRGGIPDSDDEGHFRNHHHLPAIRGVELPFSIELHKSIGDGITSKLLAANEIFEHSVSSKVEGIHIPAPEHRFTHCILHAQLRSQLYARTLLNLRDCTDYHHFRKALDEKALKKMRERFEAHEILHLVDGLDQLTDWIFGTQKINENSIEAKWAAKALRNFGRPQTQKYFDTFVWIKTYLQRFIKEPQKRRHYLKKLFSVNGWIQFIGFQKERIGRFK